MRSRTVSRVAALAAIGALVAGLADVAMADPIVPGQRLEGRVAVPGLAIGFTLPNGVAGVLPAGSEWFHVGRDGEEGRVFVYAGRAPREQMRALMAQPFPVAGAVMLTPRGAPRDDGDALVGDYAASDGTREYAARARVRTGATGVSVVLVAVAAADRLEPFARLAREIAATLRFDAAAAPAAPASAGAGASPWAAALANHRVVKYHHGSGYSERTEFLLCGDGRFARRFGATSVSGIGTGVARDRNGGRWSVQGSTITLAFDDGEVVDAQLEDRGGQLWVDGERWLREPFVCQ